MLVSEERVLWLSVDIAMRDRTVRGAALLVMIIVALCGCDGPVRAQYGDSRGMAAALAYDAP